MPEALQLTTFPGNEMWVTSSYVNGQALKRIVFMSLWAVSGHTDTQRLLYLLGGQTIAHASGAV